MTQSLKLYSNGDSEYTEAFEVVSFDDAFEYIWNGLILGENEEEVQFTHSFLPYVENYLSQYLESEDRTTDYFAAGNGSGSYVKSEYNSNDYISVFDLYDYQTIFDSDQVLDMELDFSAGLDHNFDEEEEEALEEDYGGSLDNYSSFDNILDYLADDVGEGKYVVANSDYNRVSQIEPTTSFNAFYGYGTTDTTSFYIEYLEDLALGFAEYEISGNDKIIGSVYNDGIWAGPGDDVISGSNTTSPSTADGDYTIVVEDSSNKDSITIEFESDGADFLFANEGDDVVYGGQGDTVISGGDGNDVIYESVYDEDENHIFGGEGIDTFIINANPNSGSGSGSGTGSDFLDYAYDNILTDLSDTVFTTLKELAPSEIGFTLNLIKEVVPIAKDILDYIVDGAETSAAEPVESTQTSTVIYDFDPTEDFLVVYHDDDDTVAFDTAGDIYDGLPGITFKNNDDEFLVHLGGDFFNDDANAKDYLSTQYTNNAIYVEKVGGEYQIRQGGETYSEDELDNFSFSDLGITDYESGFFIVGAFGPQTVYGTENTDKIYGTEEYSDVLYGYTKDNADTDDEDEIFGYGGDDWLDGGEGDDELYGGDGSDTAFFIGATQGVYVDLSNVSVDTDGEEYATANDGLPESSTKEQGLDKLYSIENLSGSSYSDTLIGDDNDNILHGVAGEDLIFGEGGSDTVSYINAEDGVTVDLINQSADDYDDSSTYEPSTQQAVTNDGYGDQDYISGIENVTGSSYDDSITGDDNNNILEGGEGNDTLEGRGGDDTIYGGTADDGDTEDDTDTVSYSTASSGISVDLEAGTASDGDGGTDTLVDIDNVIGSDYDDTFVSDSNDNTFDGGTGSDTVDYSDSDSAVTIYINTDASSITVTDGSGSTDIITNVENFIGSSSDSDTVVLSGNTSADYFSFENIENITDNTSFTNAANVTVTLLEDELDGNFSDNDLSLREALILVEDGGNIEFDASLDGETIYLLEQLEIERSVTIDGSNVDLTIDAQENSRVFYISDGDYFNQETVEITGLTITGGNTGSFVYTGYDSAVDAVSGGGIYNLETLTITDSTISGNTAEYGGGIHNDFRANLYLNNSTISNNTAIYHAGGIKILSSDTITISNSTISGNEATESYGGGIALIGGTLNLSNSTVINNIAGDDGGGLSRDSGQLNITSSLISGNTADEDGNEVYSSTFGGTTSSDGNNLFGDDSQTEAQALVNVTLEDSDITAFSDGTNPTALEDILDTTLADNGGSTYTHALLDDSPALDAGNNDDNLETDQRGDGYERSSGDATDIGAYEIQYSSESGTVSNGPVETSTVYWDANFNNEIDEEEPFTVTNADGEYDLTIPLNIFDTNNNGELDYEEGRLVATGGTDTIGDVPLHSDLWAVAGSTMITPLTTMVQRLMQTGMEHDSAEAQIKQVLGIDESVDIHTFNPVEALGQGTDTELAATTYLSHIRVAALLHGVTHFLSGATGKEFAEVDELSVAVTATGLLSLSELDADLDDEAIQKAFQEAFNSNLDDSILSLIDNKDTSFLADSFGLTLQFIDRALLPLAEDEESLLERSASIKQIAYNQIPELLYEVGANTITPEDAQTQLQQKLEQIFTGEINQTNSELAIFNLSQEIGNPKLQVTLSGNDSDAVTELGVFVVDDEQGSINGILPDEAGYTSAALERAQVIFSALANSPNSFDAETNTRILEFANGENIRFYFAQDSNSTEQVIFSNTTNLQVESNGDSGFSLAWNDDLVVDIQPSSQDLAIGTNLQNSSLELIDLTGVTGQVTAEFSVFREAAFDNEVYFYQVDNVAGEVDGFAPNTDNYLQVALDNIVKDAVTGEVVEFSADNQGLETGVAQMEAGSIIAPLIIVNGNLDQLNDDDTSNDPSIYFPYLGANSDGVDHIKLLADNTFGFEDLPKGGDFDYNDLIVKVDFIG